MNITNKPKEYKTDNNLVYSCCYHVIFCPKYRRNVLVGEIANRLKQIFSQESEENGSIILEQEIMPNHVHLLISVNPKIGVYSLVSRLKGISSNLLRKEFPELKSKLPCLWSGSKFISSVGEISLDIVKKYIEAQKGV